MSEQKTATVYLIGAGPGDPELLTLKGKRLIEAADVIVYDQLANARFLQMARPDARLINVGKHAGNHTLPQDEINKVLVREAGSADIVVRLKGGDPFIFGRGGEEAQFLKAHGVAFEVVPGVTSAASVPAYAGIPVTHRDETATVTFITGHEAKEDASRIPWSQLAQMNGTLVFLMGLSNLPRIAQKLTDHGAESTLPVAVISHGTRGDQVTVTGTLKDIAERVQKAQVKTPALIVVGSVVGLREELQWFEKRPLFGKRILVTREQSQATEFADTLAAAGAVPYVCPLIRLEPVETELARLKEMLTEDFNADWLVFTSSNGVKVFMDTLFAAGGDVRRLGNVKLAAIGEKTCEALRSFGLNADCVPGEYKAEALAESLLPMLKEASRVVLARAYQGRPILAEMLREAGHTVEEISLYDTLPNDAILSELKEALKETDYVTLASASAADALARLLTKEGLQALQKGDGEKPGVRFATIGPVTAAALKKHGVEPDIQPSVYTTQHMIEAISQQENS